MTTRDSLRLDTVRAQLDAAARAAHDVRTRLQVVQTSLLDMPRAVTVDDVTVLYAVSHDAETLERSLRDLYARLGSAVEL